MTHQSTGVKEKQHKNYTLSVNVKFAALQSVGELRKLTRSLTNLLIRFQDSTHQALFQQTDATIAVSEVRIRVQRLDLETLSSVARPIQLSIAELRLHGLNILRNPPQSTCSVLN